MKLYLRQNTQAGETLFTVYDACGEPLYMVEGGLQALGGRMNLLTEEKKEIAHILRVGLSTISTYEVSVEGKEHFRIIQNLASRRTPFRLHGLSWHFRGSVYTRSFDLVDVDHSIIMTHGRCWNASENCFALEINHETDVPFCLCIAVIVDSAVQSGKVVALPVS